VSLYSVLVFVTPTHAPGETHAENPTSYLKGHLTSSILGGEFTPACSSSSIPSSPGLGGILVTSNSNQFVCNSLPYVRLKRFSKR
jgi:hypothetical protein